LKSATERPNKKTKTTQNLGHKQKDPDQAIAGETPVTKLRT